jgi:hypothetical protein
MLALTDYSQAIDHAGERDEAIARAHEAAVDCAFIDLRTNPLREADRCEALQTLMDSGNGPARHQRHEQLIEGLAGIPTSIAFATDAAGTRKRMLLLDAIFSTALADATLDRIGGAA